MLLLIGEDMLMSLAEKGTKKVIFQGNHASCCSFFEFSVFIMTLNDYHLDVGEFYTYQTFQQV